MVLFSGCIQQQPKAKFKLEEKKSLLKSYLDGFIASNKNYLDNQITKDDANNKLKKTFIKDCLGDSIKCISELPLKYEMMLQYGDEDKYVIKFELASTGISYAYDVTFLVLSVVNKETASKLKDECLYYIYGSCYDFANSRSFVLPSRGTIEDYPEIHKDSGFGKPLFDLGTLIVKNISFKEAKL